MTKTPTLRGSADLLDLNAATPPGRSPLVGYGERGAIAPVDPAFTLKKRTALMSVYEMKKKATSACVSPFVKERGRGEVTECVGVFGGCVSAWVHLDTAQSCHQLSS